MVSVLKFDLSSSMMPISHKDGHSIPNCFIKLSLLFTGRTACRLSFSKQCRPGEYYEEWAVKKTHGLPKAHQAGFGPIHNSLFWAFDHPSLQIKFGHHMGPTQPDPTHSHP